MTVSIKQHFTHAPSQEAIEFKRIQDAVLADLTLLRAEVVLIGTTAANYKTIYDAHTHKLPATPIEDENTSAPDTTAATGSKAPGTASAFTDSTTAIAALNLVS